MNKDELARALAPSLNERGFRKKARTWWRETSDLVQVFNIQGSSWSKDTWYLNVGIFLNALDKRNSAPSEADCHVRERLYPEIEEPAIVVAAIDAWFAARATVQALAELEFSGKLGGGLVSAQTRKFLRALATTGA